MSSTQAIEENKAGIFTTALIIISILAASVEPIVVKLGFRTSATPLQLLIMKIALGGILVLPFTRTFEWIGLKGLRKMAWVCFLFMLTNILVFFSLQHLSAVTVITVFTTTPAFVALVNQQKGRDVLAPTFWPGFILCFLGVLITIEIFQPGSLTLNTTGLFYIFASVACSTAYRTAMDDITASFNPLNTANYIFLSNGLVALIALPFAGPIPEKAIPAGLWLGLAGVAANISFLAALKVLGSTRISIFGILQRPVIIVASSIILSEPLDAIQAVGILMVIGGVYLARVEKREEKPVEQTLQQQQGEKSHEKN